MNIKKILFFLLITSSYYIHAEQFIYPVAPIDNEGEEILVVYQKSLNDIELWIWNSATKIAIKGLLSTYIPAGIKMLPSGAGFSFIDGGRLRVKYFYKRSPKTIAIYQPISKITDINWISDDAFYFSAKEGDAYNIFSSNTLGEVQRCTFGQDSDYLYPCKIGKAVFCIEREKNRNIFKIVKIKWLLCDYESEFAIPQSKEVLLTTSQSISYLHMISEDEGFYLDYSLIHSGGAQELLLFSCCRIFKDSFLNWVTEKMFEFKIPSLYVIGKEANRLYESLAPLLPNYSDAQFVYFVDANTGGGLDLKKYDKYNKNVETVKLYEKINFESSKIISPLFVRKNMYAGFVIDEKKPCGRLIDTDGTLFFDLPEISVVR